ncbi:MAG: ABC transporter ATP-binding protein [Thermodesulfobacteriota bacterium]|jgi:tungstate transport system ATP-binding protein|nr:ABC transporter ATP-binding protein [Thermodesulfobacteriota bacterium]
MNPILSIHNLEYRRGNQFNLSVERMDFAAGRMYFLAGANGAGKSTLLQLLALLLPPDKGEIRFNGNSIKGAAGRHKYRRQITLVEQSPFLFDNTVYNNLAFGLRLRDINGDLQRRRILKALHSVGLEGFENRRARALSGGESRRVALARALVIRPKVLLLDEPTAGLDDDSLSLFETNLAALTEAGVAVIMSTHDGDQARRLNGEVSRLENGRLTQAVETSSSEYRPMENVL